MTEHGHLQVFVLEPRQETWGIEHTGFAYGGGGLTGVFGTSNKITHSVSNHHYTHATFSPYLPNRFGTTVVGTEPLQQGAGADDEAGIIMDTIQEMLKPDTMDASRDAAPATMTGGSGIGQYLAAKPSYALILLNVWTDDGNEEKGAERDKELPHEFPSERVRTPHADDVKIWRIGNMESPVAYDHAGHWRESWADLGVQSGTPLSGGVFPWNGLPSGYRCYGSSPGTRPWSSEARRIENALKHTQFDFVPSKPLLSSAGIGVVGSNGLLVCFEAGGDTVRKYNIEHFGPGEEEKAIVTDE